ncbi:MAG: hypothetical protein LBI63_01780 [Candidatus Ancillula sp.]|jgi:hypothetical protein|nr:hypothetical protein [Candidatus Ancillula sp.]
MVKKITFLSKGFTEILTSQATLSLVKKKADEVAKRAGEGFEVKSRIGDYKNTPRAIAVVYPKTKMAYTAQAEDFALQKAVGGMK